MANTRLVLLTSALVLGGALCAQALPHVWVTTETTVLYDNGTFVGLRHKWTFDELYAAMAIEGLDKNKDGEYDREELAGLAKADIEGMHGSSYFTIVTPAGQELKLGSTRDYWVEHKDGILLLYFTAPFVQQVLVEAKCLTFAISDPEYFIAFEFAKIDPARLSEGTPKSCKVGIQNREADHSLSDALQRQFGAFAVSNSKAVAVECDTP